MKRGLTLWADNHNSNVQNSGLPKVNINIVDSQASSKVAVEAYQRLRSETTTPLVFSTYTNVASAIAPFVKRDNVAVLQAGQGTRTPKLGKTFIQIVPSYEQQSTAVLHSLLKKHVRSLTIIGPSNDEAFSDEAKRLTEVACPKLGCKVSKFVSEDADGSNAKLAGSKAERTHADAIVAMGVPTQIVPVLQKLNTDSYKGVRMGYTDFNNIAASGKYTLLRNSLFSAFYHDPNNPTTKALDKAYRRSYDSSPKSYTYAAYETGQLIDAVLERVKQRGTNWTGESIVKAAEHVKVKSIAGTLTVGTDRRTHQPIAVNTVNGHAIKRVNLWKPSK
jgi:ABC-type branched-subunit amino acid transport system substrate-binding protein